MEIRFLGTNGWYCTETGNSICTALVAKSRLIVFDAGDGFHKIGDLAEKAGLNDIDVFISHLHLDHVVGLHMLAKLDEGMKVRVFVAEEYIEKLNLLVDHPFTAHPEDSVMEADVEIIPLKVGTSRIPYSVEMLKLDHSDPAFGFRVELDGKAVAYCADSGPCGNLVALGRDADALIVECALLPDAEINPKWPHMNPKGAAEEAVKANTKRLVLTHFGAHGYSSLELRKDAEAAARKIFKSTVAAYDNETIRI